MKVLVTGATGRIGKSLLLQRPPDAEVEILLDPLDQSVPDFPWYRSDISDREKGIMAVTCYNPDVVIHLAAATDVDACEKDPDTAFRINSNGTGNIADACVRCGAKMVYLSTDYVFDGFLGPYSEEDSTNPVNVYGRSKLGGEYAVSSIIDNYLIVRISVPFGIKREGVNHNFVSWLFDELAAEHTLEIADDQFTTPAYMEELAEVLWTLIRNDVRGTVYYGTSNRLSRYDMAIDVCQAMDYSEKLVRAVKTEELGFAAKRPLESGFVTDKVHDLIGRPPILFQNALYRMIESF